MDLEELKHYIKNNLYNNAGKLNSAILRQKWFVESMEFQHIVMCTNFLNPSATLSNRIYCIMNDIHSLPLCEVCNTNPKAFITSYLKTCNSQKCKSSHPAAIAKRKKSMVEKYGDNISPLTKEKIRQRIPNFIKKSKETLLIKYNVDNCSKIPGHKEKLINSNIKKYGVKHFNFTESNRKNIKSNRMKRWQIKCNSVKLLDVILPSCEKVKIYKNALYHLKYCCNTCNAIEQLPYETFKWRIKNLNTPCSVCSGIVHGSNIQYKIYEWIKSIYKNDVVLNDRMVLSDYNMELDIYIPDKNIAIEIDGVFWHSFNSKETPKQKNYHKFKYDLCNNKNIKLIRIPDVVIEEKQDIIKSKIKNLLGFSNKIYARNTNIVLVNKEGEKEFLNKNHLQGYIKSDYCIGLIFGGELISIMSMGKSRFDKSYEWEMLRFCNKIDLSIVGGLSKLYNRFIKDNLPKSIVSYADLRYGDGKSYSTCGFKHIKNTSPNYYWIKNNKILSRMKFQKHKLQNILDFYDEGLSESENMFNNGYRRLWDCGNAKWVHVLN